MENRTDDFYIGWQEKAAAAYAKKVRRFVLIVGLVIVAVATLFVLNQRGFADSVFEFGQLTEVEGLLIDEPVPMLKIQTDDGSFQTILLVGFGKIGALPTLQAIADEQGEPLSGKVVKLAGTRIYDDAKFALELTEGAAAFKGFGTANIPLPQRSVVEENTFQGEISDPKCLLGVMKPGEGKPHRSCAARCIAGGIPPVFKTNSTPPQYLLLTDATGNPINDRVAPFIGQSVQICGQLVRQDDWLILQADFKQGIEPLSPAWLYGDVPMCH